MFVLEFLQALTHKPEGYEHLESSYYSVSFPALQSLSFDQTIFKGDELEAVLTVLLSGMNEERNCRNSAFETVMRLTTRMYGCYEK
jgi:hypothetical protein